MRVTKIGIVTLAIGGLFWLPLLQAQETAPSVLQLDLETAVEIALSENPMVKVADMEIQKKTYAQKKLVWSTFATN